MIKKSKWFALMMSCLNFLTLQWFKYDLNTKVWNIFTQKSITISFFTQKSITIWFICFTLRVLNNAAQINNYVKMLTFTSAFQSISLANYIVILHNWKQRSCHNWVDWNNETAICVWLLHGENCEAKCKLYSFVFYCSIINFGWKYLH